jgi:membrane protease YdiL (CAAX protease family)
MERESGPEPRPVVATAATASAVTAAAPFSRSRWLLLGFFLLWPWFCVSMGLLFWHQYLLTIAIYSLVACLAPALLLKGESPKLLPLKFPLVPLIGAIIAMNIGILSLFKLSLGFGMISSAFYQKAQALHLQSDALLWIACLWIVLGNPVVEERFWRGSVYRDFRTRLPCWQANLLSAFFFGAWHWVILQHFYTPPWALGLTLAVMVGGILFAWLYEKTGTLAAPILLHGFGADLPLVMAVQQTLLYCQPHH